MPSEDSSDDQQDGRLSITVCALCRQRKVKCDRQLPQCSQCLKSHADCKYLSRPRKHGLRAGYVRELEQRIESLEARFETLTGSMGGNLNQSPVPRSQATIPDDAAQRMSTNTPVLVDRPERESTAAETNAAIADLMTLPRSYFCALAETWFKEDHDWLPILEYDNIQASLAVLPDQVSYIPDVVLRAVIALKLSYSSQAISLSYKGRKRLSLYLRSEALREAMDVASLSSIRAMFVIAFLDFGSDNIQSALNIMAMCRRTGERIGIFRQLLQRIESQSPQQIGPPSRDIFMNDSAQIAQTWAVLSFDAVASLGVTWRDVTASLVDHLSGVAYISTPDFRDSFVTHVHLAAIGIQPVHEFLFAYANGVHEILEDEALLVTENMYQNLMSYVRGLPTSGYTLLADGIVDFEINHIFTRLLSHAAIIMIYQRYIWDDHNSQLARERCEDSYHGILDLVRNISDADAEVNTPTFSHFIAVAARFRLVLERATGVLRGPLFDVLLHGINMNGRRWPLARRIETVLSAAVSEIDTGVSVKLPEHFWDLKKNEHEISEDLKRWLELTLRAGPIYSSSVLKDYSSIST